MRYVAIGDSFTEGVGDELPDGTVRGWADLVAAGHEPELVERVIRLVDRAEWKRRQYPPGPKISLKAFGRDRRLPISSRWAETAPADAPTHAEPEQPGPGVDPWRSARRQRPAR